MNCQKRIEVDFHDVYSIKNPNSKKIKIPTELNRINQQTKYQISLCGLFYRAIKHSDKLKRQFQHNQGEVNALHKMDKHYGAMFGFVRQSK